MGTRLASSFRPTLLSFASVLVAATTVAADELADVLGLVPDDAVAWAVIPNLSRTNADLSDLIDRADRPELAVAGRPVDVLVPVAEPDTVDASSPHAHPTLDRNRTFMVELSGMG